MTSLEDQLRGTLRERASDITQARIRLDYPVTGSATAVRQRRGWRWALPMLVAAAILAVIVVGVVVASAVGFDGSTPPVSSPGPLASAPPAADPDAPYRYWLSETVIPTAGADVVAVLVRSGGPDVAAYGPGAMVDRWDGFQWQPYRSAATCPELCLGTLQPLDAAGFQIQPGYGRIGAGAGLAEVVKVSGLEPGTYRLRKTFETADMWPSTAETGSPIDAIGQFIVVEGGAPLVPLGTADDTQLLAYQPLLPPAGGTLPFLRRGGPPADTWMPAQVAVERWTGGRWEPSTTLAVSASPADLSAAQVEIPPSEPGAYRIVDRSTPTERQAVFWVSDIVPN